MCGRYAASRNPDDLVEEVVSAGLPVRPPPPADAEALRPSYNVAPTMPVATVLVPRRSASDDRSLSDDDGGDAPSARLRAMRWGLVPSWAKDVKVGNRMINARVETVLHKPAYRSLVGSRRCLLPAEWRDPGVADDDPRAWLGSVTVLTTAAEPGLRAVHDRMPVVLQPELWADWLFPDVPAEQALTTAVGQPEGRFTARPVGSGVGNVRNDSPDLLAPLPTGALTGVVDPATGELYA